MKYNRGRVLNKTPLIETQTYKHSLTMDNTGLWQEWGY